jgi:hypothetical protein
MLGPNDRHFWRSDRATIRPRRARLHTLSPLHYRKSS